MPTQGLQFEKSSPQSGCKEQEEDSFVKVSSASDLFVSLKAQSRTPYLERRGREERKKGRGREVGRGRERERERERRGVGETVSSKYVWVTHFRYLLVKPNFIEICSRWYIIRRSLPWYVQTIPPSSLSFWSLLHVSKKTFTVLLQSLHNSRVNFSLFHSSSHILD